MLFEGKTVDEAVEKGLTELNAAKEDVEITVIEEPVKGLFGKMKGKAVVDMAVKEKPVENSLEKAAEFVQEILKIMNISATAKVDENSESPVISVVAEKSSEVIGYRGEVLDAIQTLTGAYVNIGKENYKKVTVDCENYRNRREDTLISLAHKLETKAVEMRREVILEPMNPFERRIIHTALSDSESVTTKSEGKEPNRYVVIVPNDKDEFSTPYNAGRNNDRRGEKRFNDRRKDGKKFSGGRNGFNKTRTPRRSGFGEEIKRKTPSGFGTYLGNSLKDDN